MNRRDFLRLAIATIAAAVASLRPRPEPTVTGLRTATLPEIVLDDDGVVGASDHRSRDFWVHLMSETKARRAARSHDDWPKLFQAYGLPIGPPVMADGQIGYLMPPELQAELIEMIEADLAGEEEG